MLKLETPPSVYMRVKTINDYFLIPAGVNRRGCRAHPEKVYIWHCVVHALLTCSRFGFSSVSACWAVTWVCITYSSVERSCMNHLAVGCITFEPAGFGLVIRCQVWQMVQWLDHGLDLHVSFYKQCGYYKPMDELLLLFEVQKCVSPPNNTTYWQFWGIWCTAGQQ